MTGALITVTTRAGAFLTAVALAGLWLSIRADQALDPVWMALLMAGVLMLTLGVVSRFERSSRLWARQAEAQMLARRHELQSLGITSSPSPRMYSSAR
ncbi:hypothetical protein [Kocuria sp. KH4]